jgi:hypothetical protein
MRMSILASAWIIALSTSSYAQERIGMYRHEGKQKLIVFIHGYRSGGEEAWTNSENGTFWPELVAQDPLFNGYDIYIYDYFTEFSGRQASIHGISSQLEVAVTVQGLLNYSELLFVGHSMGGIVIRDLLNNNEDIARNTTATVTYASPYEGASLASIASYLTRSPQPIDLADGENSYLDVVNSQWLRFNGDIPSFCAYELETTNGVIVVSRDSATQGCNQIPQFPVQTDHSNIVKPGSVSSPPHTFLQYSIQALANLDTANLDTDEDADVVQESFFVNGEIWAEGARRIQYGDYFSVHAPRDGGTCSRRIIRQPHQFCPTFEGRPLQIERFELGKPEGNGGFATAEITDEGRCVTAYITSIDGGRGTLGDCRGRSWLTSQDIRFFGYSLVPNSTSEPQRVDTTIEVGGDGGYSFTQQYGGDTKGFESLEWKYNLNVSRFLDFELDSTFSLSHASPITDAMTSKIQSGLLTLSND